MTLVWRKSSRSGTNGGQCVEVAHLADTIAVRDSKDSTRPSHPTLTVDTHTWTGFLAALQAGDLHS